MVDMKKARTLVLGLDGATFKIIDWLSERGKLPNLKRLMDNGYSAELESVYPPITGPAWVSFMTGKLPANHGILDFTMAEAQGTRRVFNYTLIDGPTIYEIISSQGKKQASINVPGTWPQPEIDGQIISGLLTPDKNRAFFPVGLKDELSAKGIDYRIDADDFPKGKEREFLTDMIEVTGIQEKTAECIMEKYNPAVLYLVFRSTDSASHNFWKYFDEKHPLHDRQAPEELKNAIERIYIECDNALGRLMGKFDFENILVMSDHGFGACTSQILINNYFIEKGHLQFGKQAKKSIPILLEKFGLTYNSAKKILLKLGLFQLIKSLMHPNTRAKVAESFLSFKDIDWNTTKAFSAGNGGQIFINRKAFGSENDVIEFREKMKSELETLEFNGKKLFRKVLTKEEAFRGKYMENAPDLYPLVQDENQLVFSSIAASRKLVDNVFDNSGDHRMDGIFILWGKNIANGSGNARIIDVAPTLLHMLGIPVSKGMDGKVILEAFREKNEIKTKDYGNLKSGAKAEISADENEKIRQKLKGMGYFT